jgi:hypothetical protein
MSATKDIVIQPTEWIVSTDADYPADPIGFAARPIVTDNRCYNPTEPWDRWCADVAETGRPSKEINQQTFESLCAIQCTEQEICAVLGVGASKLVEWCKATYGGRTFQEVFAEKRQGGKASLRRKHWEMAMAGSVPLLIFALKNYAGMSDSPQQQSGGADFASVVEEAWQTRKAET